MNIEPAHKVLSNSNRYIPILVSAVADFSSYECEVDSIKFPETFVFDVSN